VVTGRPAMGKFGAVPVTRRRVTGCGRQSQMRTLTAWPGPVAGAYRSPDHRRPMFSYKGTRAPSLLNTAPRLPAVFLVRVAAGSTPSVFTNPLYATLVVVVVISIVIAVVIITICHSAERVSVFNKVFTLSNFIS